MNKLHFLFALLSLQVSLLGQYICPPCNLPCDTLHFTAAGICPMCQMELVNDGGSMIVNDHLEKILATSEEQEIMETISYLSDVYGPRLLGTPNYYHSVQYLQEKLSQYELDSIYLFNFDSNHRGWDVTSHQIQVLSPAQFMVHGHPLAFTRSTEGPQEGEALFIKNFAELLALRDSLQGKILFLENFYRPNHSVTGPLTSRLTPEELTEIEANNDPNHVLAGYYSRRSTVDVFGYRQRRKIEREKILRHCERYGVVGIIEPSPSPYGLLHVDGNNFLPSFDKLDDLKPLPTFVINNEAFGRLKRLYDQGFPVQLSLNSITNYYSNPTYNVNLLAEIRGTDEALKDEIVMIGAHLDSWHGGTGAVDNASNCAVIVEVFRVLAEMDYRPRRTIRLVLWGGEEQVFAGSKSYVDKYIGDFASGTAREDNEKYSAYLNLDNGAGRIRGLYLMGNKTIAPYLKDFLSPFPESNYLTIQNANQTDHELLDYHNVPSFQFIQDPLDYIGLIHHTNVDVYEYVPPTDQLYNVNLLTYLVTRIADADDLMPRKPFNNPVPSREGNARFYLEGSTASQKVYVIGDFNNWSMFGTPMYRTEQGWETYLHLAPGTYHYKFIVDGMWTNNPSTPSEDLVKDGEGHGGLTLLMVE